MPASTPPTLTSASYAPYRRDWLAQRQEAPLDPALPIVDAHHHLWELPRPRWMAEEMREDLAAGHNVIATVYVEGRAMYRADGPEHLRPVGEVEFANGVAAIGASGAWGRVRPCAGIVGFAQLQLGAAVRPVLEALIAAGNGRLRGIRQGSAWDPDTTLHAPNPLRPPHLLMDARFRAGFAELAPLGLTFDAFLYHTQLGELLDLARAFPGTTIVLDHCGAPLGLGAYATRRDEVFAEWHARIREIAACPNVVVKLGGLGMRIAGFRFEERALPPSSEELATAWRPWIETCIEAFGAGRAMFESNFPPDKGSCGYVELWNAFKRITAGAAAAERAALFHGTARRIYRLDLPD